MPCEIPAQAGRDLALTVDIDVGDHEGVIGAVSHGRLRNHVVNKLHSKEYRIMLAEQSTV